jgi:plastocyanin
MPTDAHHPTRGAVSFRWFALSAVAALLLSAFLMTASAPGARAASTVTVQISNFAYQPATVTIQVGDTVTWTNLDSAAHTATDTGSGALFDGVMATGESFSHTFTQAGTYDYYCTFHPEMTGTVVVQAGVPDAAMPLPTNWTVTVMGSALLLLSLLLAAGGARARRGT